jgi:hypothetical protein
MSKRNGVGSETGSGHPSFDPTVILHQAIGSIERDDQSYASNTNN